MSTQTVSIPPAEAIPSPEALTAVVGDAAMVSVLQGKPDEDIPTAVWWLVAETLRTSVTARRAISRPPRADDEDVTMLLVEAQLLTDAALAELIEGTDLEPTRLEMALPAGTRPLFGLQRSTLTLARLLVSHRPTSPQRLAAALSLHGDALRQQLALRQIG